MSASGSSTTASPPVPAVAARLKAKKRMMTLVNPADPEDFSTDSMVPYSSPEKHERGSRETTPAVSVPVIQHTPLAVPDFGVKGILRPAGTPGSGNGVRFFPKNRFRVITPREELGGPSTPQKKPVAPPPPASPSFFSQLLSVVPAMSPRRAPPVELAPPPEADESWERPGEEGEISLVASSVVSAEHSTVLGDEEEGDDGASLEVPWTGPAEVHSSPLFIPIEGCSKDISIQDIHPPEISMDRWKARMQGQEDVSNLLSTSLPGCSETSFSIGSMAGPSFLPPRPACASPLPATAAAEDISSVSWMKAEQSSMLSVQEEEDNPTIRRRLSPIPSPGQQPTSKSPSPTKPGLGLVVDRQRSPPHIASPRPTRQAKAFTSIFADMSAEQAELSWPLSRSTSGGSKLAGLVLQADETTFHSFLPSSPAPATVPLPSTSPTSEPPRRVLPGLTPKSAQTPGNDTEFFDAASSFFAGTPCPIKPLSSASTSLPSGTLTSLRPSAYTGGSLGRHAHVSLGVLANPTKNLFEAQRTHTAALSSELDMYRNLTHKLGKEVEERDKALAEMNLRLVESEMRTAEAGQSSIEVLRSSRAAIGKRKSLSPSPTPSPLAAKSVQAAAGREAQAARAEVEGEVRDLEIRLQKALAESREMREEAERSRRQAEAWEGEKVEMLQLVSGMEDRERDMEVAMSRQDAELRAELEETQRDLEATREGAEAVHAELESLRREREADGKEIERLGQSVEKAREGRRREDGLRDELEQAKREMEELQGERVEMERELDGERRANGDMEVMVHELKIALHQAQSALVEVSTTAQRDLDTLEKEASRLRAESSSKDLELMILQRRKNELKEDREMLNVALDSKQQEVELLKRKLARFSQATPLGVSQRPNLDIGAGKHHAGVQTPMPSTQHFKLHPTTAAPATEYNTKRRSSASYATPLAGNGRAMRSGAMMLMEDQRTSTVVKERVMRRVASGSHGQGENVPVARETHERERRNSRRESVLA
ncbi:uncharacterized protein MKK02DRAFT_43643 [Dioszegia hungarica]|uniref:Uncharacterized protein n=1 Tax=Dioszegia hungarica TaxID=4972 RepID=A0AA38HC99_9TREE|nr:uncharacterized protein MKK02DRAFT_43643 [Dioszegia hungarica]KAI9637715.1 hypothetical protein MKK02DRAFT_43643 [Dioszegia hungarica]